MPRLCFHHHPLGVDDPEFPDGAGAFADRPTPLHRNYATRAFTVGIGGPVGSGKTALLLALCRALRDRHNLAVVTNDIFTKEDAEFLVRNQALPAERIAAVETGGCPHTAVRDDISQNLEALHRLMREFHPELLFVESGGDNLAAQFSRDLVDFTIYVIDVSGGDKIPRKGGPGITQSDLLVINKTDLAPLVRADLGVMERDARKMRGDGPFLFAQVTRGVGVAEIIEHLVGALTAATETRDREGAEPWRDREGAERGGGPPRATEPGSGAEPRCGREGAERGEGPPRATERGSGAEPRF